MGHASLHKQCIVVVGLVGANLRAEKSGLHIVRQQLFHGLTVFFVHSKEERRQHHRHHAEGGGSVAAGLSENKKQRHSNECRCTKADKLPFGQVECDLRFTFVRSRGTEIYAANKAPPLVRSEDRFRHGTGLEQAETEQDSVRCV